MSTNILSISLSALTAAQAGIRTTSQNIANVNTSSYHRQTVNFSNSVGNGVNVDGVSAAYDRFLESEVLRSQTQLSRYETYATYAGQVDSLLGDESTGLSESLSDFFAAANEVANDPTGVAARQTLLTSGQTVANRVNELDASLEGMQSSLDQEMTAIAQQVTNLASQVAQFNQQIAALEASSGQTANDLRDQRDQAVSELNKLVNVTQFTASDGTFNLYLGSGQPLVVGSTASSMTTVADSNNPEQQVPALEIGGVQISLDSSLITGGQLGGILAFREEVLNPAQQDLASLATSFALKFNELHRSGYDQDGDVGADFFENPVTTSNAGSNLFLTLDDDTPLEVGSYVMTYDGSNYALASADGTTIATGSLSGISAAVENTLGFKIDLDDATYTPSSGDRWTFDLNDYARQMAVTVSDTRKIAAAKTADSPGDNSNALDLAALQTAKVMNGGTSSFQTYYSQLSSRVASLANASDASQQAYETLTTQATDASQSVSGVNLDEEAANLIRFQQAYQAAAKAMEISSSLFDEILSIVR